MATPAFLVMIPARLASTRLPDKPLADLGGKPMVVRVAELATRSAAEGVVVVTDSSRIHDVVRDAGHLAMLTRPDHVSGTDRLAEAATTLDLPDDAIVVNLQGDEPLLPPELLDAVATRLAEAPGRDIATVAHPLHDVREWLDPNVVKVVTDAQDDALLFSRAPLPFARDALAGFPERLPDTLPEPLRGVALRHVGLYAYRAGFLRRYPQLPPAPIETLESLEQLRALWHGHRIAVHRVADAPPGGVDTPADLARVRAALG